MAADLRSDERKALLLVFLGRGYGVLRIRFPLCCDWSGQRFVPGRKCVCLADTPGKRCSRGQWLYSECDKLDSRNYAIGDVCSHLFQCNHRCQPAAG
jgi:hypothetical protein